MTFHWAYDEDGNAQPVEKTPSGNFLAIGVDGSLRESSFIHIDPTPIQAPSINWNEETFVMDTDKKRALDLWPVFWIVVVVCVTAYGIAALVLGAN